MLNSRTLNKVLQREDVQQNMRLVTLDCLSTNLALKVKLILTRNSLKFIRKTCVKRYQSNHHFRGHQNPVLLTNVNFQFFKKINFKLKLSMLSD